MTKQSQISRRQFVGTAISAAALGSLPMPDLLASSWGDTLNTSNPDWKDEGVLFVDKSPYAKLHNIPLRAVTISQGFWGARRKIDVDSSIPSMEKLLEANGRMDNFLRLVGKSDAKQRGPVYSDSDVYKWTEAAGFALQSGDRPELRSLTDKIIKEVVAVQELSGYLNTYYVGERAKDRMEPEVQRWGHELYNLGHMIQGAIAYYRATGDRTLLDAGMRFEDGDNHGESRRVPADDRPARRAKRARRDKSLDLNEQRPCAFHSGKHGSTRGRGVPRRQKQSRRIGDLGKPAPGHFENADFLGWAKAVLDRAKNPEIAAALAFERNHGVDHMFDDAGTGDLAILGDMSDKNHRRTGCLRETDQRLRGAAYLRDRARRRFNKLGPHRLNGINHNKGRPLAMR